MNISFSTQMLKGKGYRPNYILIKATLLLSRLKKILLERKFDLQISGGGMIATEYEKSPTSKEENSRMPLLEGTVTHFDDLTFKEKIYISPSRWPNVKDFLN